MGQQDRADVLRKRGRPVGGPGAVPAAAKRPDVIKDGACSGSSDWKAQAFAGRRQDRVEYEVDSNMVGQTGKVGIFQNGNKISAARRSRRPSGSFTVRLLAANPAATDSFKARASNAATGELCGRPRLHLPTNLPGRHGREGAGRSPRPSRVRTAPRWVEGPLRRRHIRRGP